MGLSLHPFWRDSYVAIARVVNIHPGAGAFVVTAGAILGICAALLWTAQGSLMMAYPTEAEKGAFIGIFWAIFNVGGVVGSAVAFGQNFNLTVSQYVLHFIPNSFLDSPEQV